MKKQTNEKTKVELKEIKFMNCTLFVNENKPGKFEKDLKIASPILLKAAAGEKLTSLERFTLLTIYKVSYHDSGKIEGTSSLDSTATNCEFCQNMRNNNAGNKACICNYCYDERQEQYRINVLNRHTLNMLIMSTVEFTIDELKVLPLTAITRVNSSGDTRNEIYARNMIKCCYAFPFIKFGYWAKNVKPIIAACDALGKPENVKLIESACYIGKPVKKAKYFDYVFIVYPDKESTEKAIAAGASACNGKQCRACGYKCYFGTHAGNGTIAELLRGADKKTIQDIKASI